MALRKKSAKQLPATPRGSFIKRIFKFGIGLLLLPCCIVVSKTVLSLLRMTDIDSIGNISSSAWWFLGGFLFWALLFFVLPRPFRTYVIAHELSHLIWAWLFGARVSGISTREDGGHVLVNKTNFLITLAPYFFPFYTLCVLLLYAVLEAFWDTSAYEPLWMALVGLSWSFHFTFTLSTLRINQTDIQYNGRLFSYTLIYILNVLGITLFIVAVTEPTWRDLLDQLLKDGLEIYAWCRDGVLWCVEQVR